MPDESKQLEDENRQLEDELWRLEEENRQLEEKNRRLERNRQLRETKKQLEEKRKHLLEENNELKNTKRKAADTSSHHYRKRTRLADPQITTAIKTFFSSPQFAVAGASSDPSKYGHKVFAWYIDHKLPVTPINPSTGTITTMSGPKGMLKRVHLASPAPSRLDAPTKTSLSVITPPKVTRTVLEDAKKSGIRAVWLQPGSFDKDILQYAQRQWPGAVIAGDDIPGSMGEDGWCVLVDGEAGMSAAGRRY